MQTRSFLLAGVLAASAACATIATAQGMPPEARGNIHLLLNEHEAVTRTVTMTRDGYVALTESDNPKVAAALREHVRQMEERLKSGLMVRRHDPAFVEFAEHFDEIRHVMEPTGKGLKMMVTGTTPAAVKVAQNHATVVTDFAANGWEAHDRDHAAVLPSAAGPAPAAGELSTAANTSAPGCCEHGGACRLGGPARKAGAIETQPSAGPKDH
ncbi:MAG: hypothetical protein KF791_11880 [Verrucomicrobiae bacterium]|nr:hypothetical protein [Verrucomicrobiae bacterium]